MQCPRIFVVLTSLSLALTTKSSVADSGPSWSSLPDELQDEVVSYTDIVERFAHVPQLDRTCQRRSRQAPQYQLLTQLRRASAYFRSLGPTKPLEAFDARSKLTHLVGLLTERRGPDDRTTIALIKRHFPSISADEWPEGASLPPNPRLRGDPLQLWEAAAGLEEPEKFRYLTELASLSAGHHDFHRRLLELEASQYRPQLEGILLSRLAGVHGLRPELRHAILVKALAFDHAWFKSKILASLAKSAEADDPLLVRILAASVALPDESRRIEVYRQLAAHCQGDHPLTPLLQARLPEVADPINRLILVSLLPHIMP